MSRYDPPPSPPYSPRVRAASPWRGSTLRSSRPSTPTMGTIPLPRAEGAQVHPAFNDAHARGLGALRAVPPPICPLRTASNARVAPATRPTTPFRAVTPFRTVTPAPTPPPPAALQPDALLAADGALARVPWDMRTAAALPASDLVRPATSPGVARLRVCVGPWVFLVSVSRGEARLYVTVGAVRAALRAFLAGEIGPGEWCSLHEEMRGNATARCCVRPHRLDAFGQDTHFAGLRPSRHSAGLLVLQTAGGLL